MFLSERGGGTTIIAYYRQQCKTGPGTSCFVAVLTATPQTMGEDRWLLCWAFFLAVLAAGFAALGPLVAQVALLSVLMLHLPSVWHCTRFLLSMLVLVRHTAADACSRRGVLQPCLHCVHSSLQCLLARAACQVDTYSGASTNLALKPMFAPLLAHH